MLAQIVPASPCSIGTHLPVIPDVVVCANTKNLQTPIRVRIERTDERAESRFGGLRVSIRDRKNGSSSTKRQNAFQQETGHDGHYSDNSIPVQDSNRLTIKKVPAQIQTKPDLRGSCSL